MTEIGSEFHAVCLENSCGFNVLKYGYLVFSGRTAIENVLKEIPQAK
jgi:hypothetical protein